MTRLGNDRPRVDPESSFFEDPQRFPQGSVRFDSALLMRDLQHE